MNTEGETKSIVNEYVSHFGGNPLVVRSPGRINLIGEHTDYNDGFVLPGAIDRAVYVAIGKSHDDRIRLFASEYKDFVEIDFDNVRPSFEKPWANYILGVVDQFRQMHKHIGGFNLVITGDIPLGAGLSSSAAAECATAFALNELFHTDFSRLELVRLSQKAEHEFAGVKCGIMDQFASMFGKKDHVIRLDCRSLDYEFVPLKPDGYKIVLFDTQVRHSLASTEYNTRREECEYATRLVRAKYPTVRSLRDASVPMLEECVKPAGQNIFKRAGFIIREIERVISACEDLSRGDLPAFGKKMYATHEGLSKHYEVSCPELDFLVDSVRSNPAVLGARMMGGGFGGCTINLVRGEEVDSLGSSLAMAYKNRFGIDLKSYEVNTDDGTALLASSV